MSSIDQVNLFEDLEESFDPDIPAVDTIRKKAVFEKNEQESVQTSLEVRYVKWKPPTYFPNISNIQSIGLDTECRDPYLTTHGCGAPTRQGSCIGISLYTNQGFNGYFPFAHLGGGKQFEKENVVKYFKELLSKSNLEIATTNGVYDLLHLRALGIEVNGIVRDVQSVESLINENSTNNTLKALTKKYEVTLKDESEIEEFAKRNGLDPKKDIYKMPSYIVGNYAESDARGAYEVLQKQKTFISNEKLWDAYAIESDIIPVIRDMQWRGIPFDVKGCEKSIEEFIKLEKETQEKLKYVCGRYVPIYKPEQIGPICSRLGIWYPLTPTGKPSFTKAFLERSGEPFLQLLRKARQLNGVRTKFLQKIIDGFVFKGRIHGTINSVAHINEATNKSEGTKQRRFSITNPPLQTIPKRNEWAHLVRKNFIADEGMLWAKLDWSQQEPRLALHFAYKLKLWGAAEARQKYIQDPDVDFYDVMADVCSLDRVKDRDINKEMFLANMYMQTIKGYARTYGVTKEEARERFSNLNKHMPWIKELGIRAKQRALELGYVRTLSGSKRRFPLWIQKEAWKHYEEHGERLIPVSLDKAIELWGKENIERADCRKALNGACQGSGGDMVKKAMIDIYKTGVVPYLSVHDESDCPVENEKQASELQEISRYTYRDKLTVPMKVDLDLNRHWV